MNYYQGVARCEAFMNPLSASDVFILNLNDLKRSAGQRAAPANGLALHELDG
jgi:hypothetical protein